MKKIKLTESELIDLIEKLVKENLSAGNGQNFGLMGTPTAKYQDLIEDEDIEDSDEDSDEDSSKKVNADEGRDTEGEYKGAPSKVEKRDTYDGRPGKVVGVYSNIKKQRVGESKKKTIKLSENELIHVIKRVVNEQTKKEKVGQVEKIINSIKEYKKGKLSTEKKEVIQELLKWLAVVQLGSATLWAASLLPMIKANQKFWVIYKAAKAAASAAGEETSDETEDDEGKDKKEEKKDE